jgi:hypothetical protein
MTARFAPTFRALLTACLLTPAFAAHAGDAPAPKPPAESKQPDDATKAEAAQRFERGIKLFNAGDNAGALAEFKRIYEILPNPVVLYNLGLVYAAMGRPVDAVDALEGSLQSGKLSQRDREHAEQMLADQKARVGRLTVTTLPEGALIEVDNVQVAKTPLSAPIRVSQGTHIIGAVAEGFAPARKELVIAGNADATLHLELVPTQSKQVANLFVKTRTLAAEVVVDGQVVGKTPLPTTVTLAPGAHQVEVRRPGYVTLTRKVEVAEGATGELSFDLAVDANALPDEGATLVLDASESPVELTIDGERRGLYAGPVRLPRGPHRLAVAAAGFVPLERKVDLDPTRTNVIPAVLEPTPETRARYESSANFHRTWGIVGLAAGAAIGGTGVALVVVGGSNLSDAEADAAALETKLNNSEPPCDWLSGFESSGGTAEQCDSLRNDAQDEVNSAKTLRTIGFIGIGAGAAVAATGLVLILTGDDPNRYDRSRDRARLKTPRPRVALTNGPTPLGAGLSLRY